MKKTESEIYYQDCIDAIYSINDLIQKILIPEVFSVPIIYIKKDLLYNSQDKFLSEKTKALDSYKSFTRLYKDKLKKKYFSDDLTTFYLRLDNIIPIFNKTIKEVEFILKHHVQMKKRLML